MDGLVIPGGESTTMLKLLRDLNLLEPVRNAILEGLPVFGTCAGLILLARKVTGQDFDRLSTMDIDVCRNAYGRQLGSFYTEDKVEEVGDNIPMTFMHHILIRCMVTHGLWLLSMDILLRQGRATSLSLRSIRS